MCQKSRLWAFVPVATFLVICILYYFRDIHFLPSFEAPSFEYLKSTLLGNSTQTGQSDYHDDSPAKLSQLCSDTKWQPGLWLHCHSHCGVNRTSVCGGLNNARNRVQTCIRMAIDAGAGLIIPSATARDEKDLLNTNDKIMCADVFWNMQFLEKKLGKYCPQLELRMCDDRRGIERVIESPRREYLEEPFVKGAFRETIAMVVSGKQTNLRNMSTAHQVVFDFGDSYIGWNYRASNELDTIRKALFKTLTFNRQLLDLSTQISHDRRLKHDAYIGVHLRGESDWPAGFGSADDQMRLYTKEIERIQSLSPGGTNTIYVSCGDQSVIQRFRDLLSPLGYTVLDKNLILSSQPATLKQLEALPFDRKAIVEYQVLVNAKFFMGVIMSSMSSLIAYARTVDDPKDYFDTYVFPGTERNGLERIYSNRYEDPAPAPQAINPAQDAPLPVADDVRPARQGHHDNGLAKDTKELNDGIHRGHNMLLSLDGLSFPGNVFEERPGRIPMEVPRMLGDNRTMLMVVNGVDIMDSFP